MDRCCQESRSHRALGQDRSWHKKCMSSAPGPGRDRIPHCTFSDTLDVHVGSTRRWRTDRGAFAFHRRPELRDQGLIPPYAGFPCRKKWFSKLPEDFQGYRELDREQTSHEVFRACPPVQRHGKWHESGEMPWKPAKRPLSRREANTSSFVIFNVKKRRWRSSLPLSPTKRFQRSAPFRGIGRRCCQEPIKSATQPLQLQGYSGSEDMDVRVQC